MTMADSIDLEESTCSCLDLANYYLIDFYHPSFSKPFMKRLLSIIAFSLVAFPHALLAQPKSAAEFIAAYKTAIREKDARKIEVLIYTKGVSAEDQQRVAKSHTQSLFLSDLEIESVTLSPLPENFKPIRISNGKKFEIIPPPAGYVQIQREGKITSKTPYAVADGIYYLTSAIITDLNWKGPQDKPLMFSVTGTGNHKVKVFVKWNTCGVDQEETYPNSSSLNDDCNASFNGQYISEITVTSDQPGTDVTLSIDEDLKEIYKSEPLKGVGKLHYKK